MPCKLKYKCVCIIYTCMETVILHVFDICAYLNHKKIMKSSLCGGVCSMIIKPLRSI